jgi:hypothetical protein
MPTKSRFAVAAIAAALCFSAVAGTAPEKTLRPFASEAELAALFKGWAAQQKLEARRAQSAYGASQNAPAAAPAVSALAKSAEATADSITNVQHAGVDEGGIVKLHGDYLVILRRGRLFTVEVSRKDLKPVSTVDAFGDGVDPRGAWYDEMLISGNTIAVIGYSYQRGGTEIGLFEISGAGQLSYKATYHLRSNDYYSSRNYASRLIGAKLVFYTPLYLNPWSAEPFAQFPAMRKWRSGATQADFRRIAPATRIYRSDEPLDPHQGLALHSVTVCDLAAAELACESSAVLGPAGRVFYVSPESVFVWNVKSAVFRIPLDGSAPSALKVAGSPIDQFSFLEGGDGFLNVLVRANGRGEAMWSSERGSARGLAMLRVPLSSFSDGRDSAPREAYRALPSPGGFSLQNRFVGSYLLYGAARHGSLYAYRYAIDDFAHEVPLSHGIDRIEALGDNAIAVGTSGADLTFTSVRLGAFPVAADRYTRKGAAQGETRSHGFFYKADNRYEGLLGLPIIGPGRSTMRHQLRHESASLLYLRNQGLKLSELGTLDSRPTPATDGCRASCVDWYGNSRPLFLKNRVFALMGYELVEGRLDADKIVEARRVDFAPRRAVDIGL